MSFTLFDEASDDRPYGDNQPEDDGAECDVAQARVLGNSAIAGQTGQHQTQHVYNQIDAINRLKAFFAEE